MKPDELHTRLRENLARLIEQRGLSQRGLSRSAALDDTAVKQILSGRSRSPRLETIARLSHALGTNVSGLIGEEADGIQSARSFRTAIELLRRAGIAEVKEKDIDLAADTLKRFLSGDDIGDVAGNPLTDRSTRLQDETDA